MTQEDKQLLLKWCEKKKKELRWYPLTMHTIVGGNPNKDKIGILNEFIEKISKI